MVEFGNGWDPNEEFDDLLGILDFPMESLEGDELAGDWDISNLQLPGFFAPIDGQLSNHVDTSSSHIHQPNKLANVQDSGAFKTQSPVSVLDNSGSCLGGKGLSIKSNNAIPVRSRSKRGRPVGANPWLLASPVFSTSQKAQKSNESKKKSFQHPSAMDFMKDSPQKAGNLKIASSHHSKKCLHCESTKTPQWRDGPMGPKTLCNACGVRYRSGRLFPEYRPANSPSFTPSKHSNSHKKVIEMRNKQPAGIIKPSIQITEPKQLPIRVGASTSHVCQQNKFSSIQQSPVSVLGSRCKRARSAVVYPSLLASKTLNTTSKEALQMAKDPEMQQLSNHIAASTSVDFPESGAFKTQRPLSVHESKGSILAGKSSSIEHDNPIPVQSRKRVRPTRLNQSFSSELSTSQKTLNTKRSKEDKKKPFQHLAAMNFLPIKVEFLPAISDLGQGQNLPLVNRKCAHCESTKTPQWREGPMGLLCNACGVCYKKGRLFPEYRPADSPTFVPSMHSNSHRRVIEMRNKANQLEGEIKVTPIYTTQEAKTEGLLLSPQPEFVPMSSYFFDYIK